MKLLLSLAAVIACWLTPLGDAEYTSDMVMRSGMSLTLMMIVIYLSSEYWAVCVALIELILVIINTYIIATWPMDSWFVVHYASLQKVAFMMEVLIIIGAGADGVHLFISRCADHFRVVFTGRGNQ